MFIRSQDGREIYNFNRCYRIYCCEEIIYLQLQAGDRWDDYKIGIYESSERTEKVFDEIFKSMFLGKKTFVMPKE